MGGGGLRSVFYAETRPYGGATRLTLGSFGNILILDGPPKVDVHDLLSEEG